MKKSQKLKHAILNGNLYMLSQFKKRCLNRRIQNGMTPLIYAWFNNLDIMYELLYLGADVNGTDIWGWSLIAYAADEFNGLAVLHLYNVWNASIKHLNKKHNLFVNHVLDNPELWNPEIVCSEYFWVNDFKEGKNVNDELYLSYEYYLEQKYILEDEFEREEYLYQCRHENGKGYECIPREHMGIPPLIDVIKYWGMKNKYNIILSLLYRGANVNILYQGKSPLYYASDSHNIFCLLLDWNADIGNLVVSDLKSQECI
jgi:hypothetical protein